MIHKRNITDTLIGLMFTEFVKITHEMKENDRARKRFWKKIVIVEISTKLYFSKETRQNRTGLFFVEFEMECKKMKF